jgi:hypothetical protein
MISTRVATVEEIARYLLEIAEDKSVFRRMWTHQTGEVAEIWIMTEPIDVETEKRIHGLGRELYKKFPNTLFDVRLLNLRLSDSPDLSFLVPRNAKLFNMH